MTAPTFPAGTAPVPVLLPAGLRLIVIGASAGGVEALRTLFAAMPVSLGVPVIVVLHIGNDARWDWSKVFPGCELAVREAEDREAVEAGKIYIAPADYHLLLNRSGELGLSVDEPVHFARPSIDVFFESAAWAMGSGVLGILLSGANADGAAGLAAIERGGGTCWVQAPETAFMDVMPRAGLQAVPLARSLSLQQMSEAFYARRN